MKSLVLFVPEFRRDTQFIHDVEKICSDLSLEFAAVYVTKEPNPLHQQQLLVAVHFADLVLIDGTIPEDQTDGGVYPALGAQVNSLNHVIVVSQRPLPLNVTPYRVISPSLEKEECFFSTDKIIEKLPQLISISLQEDSYPRIGEDKCQEFCRDMLSFQEEMEIMMQNSLDAREKRDSDKVRIMISYRNSHITEVEEFEKIILGVDDESVRKRIDMGCHDTYEIHRLPPASLCGEYEAHTPMRRWMLVGLLEDYIREVDEVWIFESVDANGNVDYTNSWWTIAEVVMVANINQTMGRKIKIRVYNPTLRCFVDSLPKKYDIVLTQKQIERLARNLSNTRPDTMGPECLEQINKMKKMAFLMKLIPEEGRQQMTSNIRSFSEQFVPKTLPKDDREMMIEKMVAMYSSPEEMERYASDEVFKVDFWEKISYQISEKTDCFTDGKIDIDKFMSIPMDEITSLAANDLDDVSNYEGGKLINLGTFEKPSLFRCVRTTNDRFLWLATRMGKATVRNGGAPGLERIPIYNILRES